MTKVGILGDYALASPLLGNIEQNEINMIDASLKKIPNAIII